MQRPVASDLSGNRLLDHSCLLLSTLPTVRKWRRLERGRRWDWRLTLEQAPESRWHDSSRSI